MKHLRRRRLIDRQPPRATGATDDITTCNFQFYILPHFHTQISLFSPPRDPPPPRRHSAKTKVGVKQVFEEVVQKILENPSLLANTAPGRPRDTVDPARASHANQSGGALCCG